MTTADHPRTSVIIAARNAARTLGDTLDSLLAQSDPDWETLVIDDGSVDETAELTRTYAHGDQRIACLAGKGHGAAAARNIGLTRARGRRVLFLDSDDWLDASFLTQMNDALDAAPDASVAYCGDHRVLPDGRQLPVRSDPRIAAAPFDAFARSCGVAIHAVLLERDIVDRVGGFDQSLQTCEDWDLWQRVARLGTRWVHVDLALSFYRTSEHSLTTDVDRMLADAAIVIGRGFSADDRVERPCPALATGTPNREGWTADLAKALFALWCGAFDCGRGGDGAAAVEELRDVRLPLQHSNAIASVLLEGVTVGLRDLPSQLAARWPEFGPRMTAWIAEVGRGWMDPSASRRMQYQFERLVLDHDALALAEPRCLSLTLGLRVDLRALRPVTLPPGIDRVYVFLCDGDEVRSIIDLGVLGTVTTRHWLELAISRLGFADIAPLASPSLGRSLALHTFGHALRQIGRAPGRALRPDGRQQIRAAAEREALLSAAGSRRSTGSHLCLIDRMRSQDIGRANPQRESDRPAAKEAPRCSDDRRAYWEGLFQRPDPWNYGSAYEQEKYARQLEMLPDGPIELAVELACAEGHFSERLAARVDRLIATDICETALERASARCSHRTNVEFRALDLLVDPVPDGADLVICSEVLYYVDDDMELERFGRRLAGALKHGGHLLTAHAYVLGDDPSRTGFDWSHPRGAAKIARVLSAVPGLALDHSIATELYRIDRFVRRSQGASPKTPTLETATVTADLDTDVARQVVWGGASARRAEVAAVERHRRIPVLAYHRIADHGPPPLARYRVSPEIFRAQIGWLRRNGYHSIVAEELAWFIEYDHPFVGRPVMITFDDGFQDFADVAWPILRAHDFRADVFLVTDLVGRTAEWDQHHGTPAPLMDAATIARLHSEGVSFGSHLATHRPADGLSTRELADELARSRASIGEWTGRPADAFTAPHGRLDERTRRLAAECGYQVGFNFEAGVAGLESDPLNLPRIEIRGDAALEDFEKPMRDSR